MARVLLVHWNEGEAKPRIGRLRGLGHDVTLLRPDGMPSLRAPSETLPELIVIDLDRQPAQGRAVATALRQRKATRGVPLVFVGGEPAKVARVRETIPDAVYTQWRGIRGALSAAARPRREAPVVPGTMAGYSGTPLPRKLGLSLGRSFALLDAPQGFERTLGALPEGVAPRDRGPVDVCLLFVDSEAALRRRLPAGQRRMGERGRLWIAWPKQASGVVTDITQNGLRDYCLARGLVDFKVCAIDATWSGLCFAHRR